MLFDDRLATVLRKRASSEAGLRTQFRQLLDLLGTRPTRLSGPALARLAGAARLLTAAEVERLLVKPTLRSGNPRMGTIAGFVRLDELQRNIPQDAQSAILREPGLRLRNPAMVAFLAEGDPKPAAAAMATARLTEEQWLDLIPQLPVTARGFLRHRRDLPQGVKELLGKLGVRDLVLPGAIDLGEVAEVPAAAPPRPQPLAETAPLRDPAIADLRARIEAFQQNRTAASQHPRLPLGDAAHLRDSTPEQMIDLATDAEGVVTHAEGRSAPMLVGLVLASAHPGALVELSEATRLQLLRRQPLRQAALTLDAAPEISGNWRMDAVPLFNPATGSFTGYAARLYRPNLPAHEESQDSPGDAMRQVLHELRTPVNAIQGFAEIIQQQLFGAVPHEYRAHAAAIAVDAAKLLAGFDEVDRLVKLESHAMDLEEGQADFRAALAETIRRLEGVLRPRNAGFALDVTGSPFTVPIARDEAMLLSWRLLATAAAALGPGETAQLDLSSDGEELCLQLEVPETLRNAAPDTSREGQRRKVVSAGMFGPAFTFRLIEAEARAAGGSLKCAGNKVELRLPSVDAADAIGDPETRADDGSA
ncbi:sensor histidine kinase [Aurantiacibacter gilvus]|uniref:histidine kinase n=1 Tax=Aurantiacibacter gilvus TaxID=3139141 RepID=A0ABU9IBX3_9SPHN